MFAVILAAGLTPAWQQIVALKQLVPGQVNRAEQVYWCASGKVLNVGCALHQLGIESKTLSFAGGIPGLQLRTDFELLGISVRWVESQVPTRVCTTILDQSTGLTTELVENSGEVSANELSDYFAAWCEEVIDANVVVISGSLPHGTSAHLFRRMLERTTAKTVLDIRGPELDEALKRKPFVVKPNREELAKTIGHEISTEDELIQAMSELRHRGAQWVVVSNGPDPLLAMGPDELIRIQPPKILVRNPIGCGDCLAAGIAAGIDRGYAMPAAIHLGVQAAAENAQELLPARKLSRVP